MSKHASPVQGYLSNRTYDSLKFSVQIVMPGLATLYFAIAQIWGLPNAEEFVGTIAAFTVFFGTVLGVSNKNFKADVNNFDGTIDVEDQEEGKMFSLNLHSDPEDLEVLDQVVFKVNPK